MKKFKPISPLVEPFLKFLAYDISFPGAIALFPQICPTSTLGRQKHLFILYFEGLGQKNPRNSSGNVDIA